MKALGQLEQKVRELIELIGQLRIKNGQLVQENLDLQRRVDEMQGATVAQQTELNQEKEFAGVLIDSLIKDIDLVVTRERVQQ